MSKGYKKRILKIIDDSIGIESALLSRGKKEDYNRIQGIKLMRRMIYKIFPEVKRRTTKESLKRGSTIGRIVENCIQ